MANEAAWIKQKQAQLEVNVAEKYEPSTNELLIKVDVIAFSPIEAKTQKFAIHSIPYPNILGNSYAGRVEAVGSGVEGFQPGDRIATLRNASHSQNTWRFEIRRFPEDGATTILNLAAITSALHIHLNLDLPTLSGKPSTKGNKVLIYGGTSSCGGLAIKYATTAGYEVITTSSPKHKAYVESLNPNYIIDHSQAPHTLLAKIKKQGPYDAIFDTIGIPSVTNLLFDYLGSVGGGSYNTIIPPIGNEKPMPPNVQRKFAPYNWALEEPKHEKLARWFYEEYVPKGLESGRIIATRPQLVEGGLEKVQHALDLMNQNQVSGHKLVLYPHGNPASS